MLEKKKSVWVLQCMLYIYIYRFMHFFLVAPRVYMIFCLHKVRTRFILSGRIVIGDAIGGAIGDVSKYLSVGRVSYRTTYARGRRCI